MVCGWAERPYVLLQGGTLRLLGQFGTRRSRRRGRHWRSIIRADWLAFSSAAAPYLIMGMIVWATGILVKVIEENRPTDIE
jgi:hypothetical protein